MMVEQRTRLLNFKTDERFIEWLDERVLEEQEINMGRVTRSSVVRQYLYRAMREDKARKAEEVE